MNKPNKRHANKILDWCLNNYGLSKYNKIFPEIEYKKHDYYTEGCVAYYDEIDGIIFISRSDNDSLYELANSIIHEYTHYKQNMNKYQILSKTLSDAENPMEIEAYEIAERDSKKCLKEVFNIII
jgi:hypothetical protein